MPETTETVFDPSALKYDADGLIPAILQVAATQEVVGLWYMTEETLRRTLETGQGIFWSRSRREVWHKGATSGDYLTVVGVRTDCDQDALLLQVEPLTGQICHTGAHSDFVGADDETPLVVRI